MATVPSSIYQEIASRTGGDIYLGVVGPVRSGKSTFIKRFMETLVLPNMAGDFRRERAMDELPQSAAGKTIMTTEPKFIPEDAVRIELEDHTSMNVRLIDCVGYIVPSVLGYIENELPSMVKTPWFEAEIPFNMAAEVGTRKVITEHSTVGIVVTTDGSISDIPREEYAEAEERVVQELQELGKPFIVLLNCLHPEQASAKQLAKSLSEQYGVPVLPTNCLDLEEEEIQTFLKELLFSFPIRELAVELPSWLCALPVDHWLREAVFGAVRNGAMSLTHLREVPKLCEVLSSCDYVRQSAVSSLDPGFGGGVVTVSLQESLLYQILAEQTGISISGEADLLPLLKEFASMKKEYERYKSALDEVEATGYGIVLPTQDELSVEEPEIVRQGGKYGVRLRAQAPSIHMVKCTINTEVSPIVGSESQGEDLVLYLMKEFEENPKKIWESNIFGKSLHDLVNEGLHNKLYRMPMDARMKLQETIERIINDGCNGLICVIL